MKSIIITCDHHRVSAPEGTKLVSAPEGTKGWVYAWNADLCPDCNKEFIDMEARHRKEKNDFVGVKA